MAESEGFLAKRPLLEHLDEFLIRLRRAFLWVFLGAVISYARSSDIIYWLESPLLKILPEGGKLVFTAPFEKIWVYMRVSTFAGLGLALPFVGWEVSRFLGPGLKAREKRRIVYFVLSFALVFALGVALGYRYVLPLVIDAAVRFGGGEALPFLTLSSYVNVALGVLLFAGLLLELPVVMVHLSAWGWVSALFWARSRRFAIVANAVVSAILSPPDALSMVLMMIPLQLLYECGVWGARVAQWGFYDSRRK